MAGKGSKLRKGANFNNYWDNYPFPEKNTVLNWSDKFGDKIIDKVGFHNHGRRIYGTSFPYS
jgi:hypothetical protein